MPKFFVAEKEFTFSLFFKSDWKPCRAKTLSAAKRSASNRRLSQGTVCYVGEEKRPGVIEVAAIRYPHNEHYLRPGWRDPRD